MSKEKVVSYEDYKKFWEEHPNFPRENWGYDECKEFADFFYNKGYQQSESDNCELLTIAYLDGASKAKELLMKNTFEREVKADIGGYPYVDVVELGEIDNDIAKIGDKVRVIIIKEN